MSSVSVQQLVDQLLEQDVLPTGQEIPCPYLPHRVARNRGFTANQVDPEVYHALLDRGFRRSGSMFYQPCCRGCRECVQTRIPVERFCQSRSQRRLWRRNRDLSVTVGQPRLSPDKWRMFRRYLSAQHDGTMSGTWEDLCSFLYCSPVNTIELCFKQGNQLVGVSIADRSEYALSSVYMYFDPTFAHRRVGTYSILWELDYCRQRHIPYYYLGFYIKDCGKMNYKAYFRPQQHLRPDGVWQEAS